MEAFDWKQNIGDKKSGFFHHAFLIEGTFEGVNSGLKNFLSEEFEIKDSVQDFFEQEWEVFGIDESRELKDRQSRRSSLEGVKKVFLLGANSFTGEAQNAMLKMFEEPSADTIFFVVTPSADFFLPTLRSRMIFLSLSGSGKETDESVEFLAMSIDKRLTFIDAITKRKKKKAEGEENAEDSEDDDEDDDLPKYDIARAKRLIEGIIRNYHERGREKGNTTEELRALELAVKYREYANGRSPSLKMMLQHLALVAPR